MRTRATASLLAVLLIATPVATAGCFGSFGLTRKVWQFNDDVSSSKLVKWLVFLGLNVIPVYEVSVLLDAFIFNSVEFWTGGNAMSDADGHRKTVHLADGSVLRLEHDPRTHQITAQRLEDGRVTDERVFVPQADGMSVLDGEGRTLIRLREDASGDVELRGPDGALVARHDHRQVERLQRAYAQHGATGLVQAVRQVADGEQVRLAAGGF